MSYFKGEIPKVGRTSKLKTYLGGLRPTDFDMSDAFLIEKYFWKICSHMCLS